MSEEEQTKVTRPRTKSWGPEDVPDEVVVASKKSKSKKHKKRDSQSSKQISHDQEAMDETNESSDMNVQSEGNFKLIFFSFYHIFVVKMVRSFFFFSSNICDFGIFSSFLLNFGNQFIFLVIKLIFL